MKLIPCQWKDREQPLCVSELLMRTRHSQFLVWCRCFETNMVLTDSEDRHVYCTIIVEYYTVLLADISQKRSFFD